MAIFYSYVSLPEGKEAYTAFFREVAMNHAANPPWPWTISIGVLYATSIYNKVYQLS